MMLCIEHVKLYDWKLMQITIPSTISFKIFKMPQKFTLQRNATTSYCNNDYSHDSHLSLLLVRMDDVSHKCCGLWAFSWSLFLYLLLTTISNLLKVTCKICRPSLVTKASLGYCENCRDGTSYLLFTYLIWFVSNI